jgi:hypothetical protein
VSNSLFRRPCAAAATPALSRSARTPGRKPCATQICPNRQCRAGPAGAGNVTVAHGRIVAWVSRGGVFRPGDGHAAGLNSCHPGKAILSSLLKIHDFSLRSVNLLLSSGSATLRSQVNGRG